MTASMKACLRRMSLRQLVVPTFLFIFLACGLGSAVRCKAQEFVPGEVLVGIRDDKDDDGVPDRLADIGTSVDHLIRIHVHRLKLKAAFTVAGAIVELKKRADVLFAEPNYIVYGASTPNDTLYSDVNQYGVRQVQANLAWDLWRPQQQIIIAVLDTGIDPNHPDLTTPTTASSARISTIRSSWKTGAGSGKPLPAPNERWVITR